MKKNTLYIASFVAAAMILQSFTPNLTSSNDKDQKKQKDHEKHNNEHDDHDNRHSKGHGHNNGGSININIDLGKDLKHQLNKKDHDNNGNHDKDRDHDNGEHNGKGDSEDHNKHNNYGQQRAFEARNKHHKFKPNNEREAFEGIQIVIQRNNTLIISIKQKIDLARKRNKYKHDNGLISLAIFNSNKRQIELCEARRVSLDLHISL
ncbi:MAG: hypothetical protein RI883_1888 [Bacteroidota bacterium]|jgi:hypothetical protein